ncbi:IclR family transcriptional regulator [Noviherbaspirillum saxi]|uniref:IclR family transcriptional regulator n=2 Tax=Noviherbaspirillum saxi TaxID=2320863 RepID=A0A3A3FIN6_9BURK|nr:IclR family transcriptional regulator [Noviherbaspirillum saxi]
MKRDAMNHEPNMHDDAPDGPESAELPMRGTQSVRRALDLLRHVAQGGEKGAKIADLVRESGLDRATAYRLMTCLVEEQFVDRDEKKIYRLGPEAVLLGSLMPRLEPMLRRLVPVMKRIARISGDTVFLMMRQGDHVQCAHREEGSSLVKVLTTHVGQRRLLGMGTGGAAVTGLIPPEELVEAYRRHEAEYAAAEFSLEELQSTADAARAQGYSLTYDAVEVGVAGIGMAFKIGTNGMGAISLGTLTARFGKERQCQLRDLFRNELEGAGLLDSPAIAQNK